jgi:Fe-S-cluster containining protein
MPHVDSIDKIVTVYLASVCSEPFTYKGVEYKPRPLTVSPLIFRGFTCPVRCGGCCPRFTLDYLPSEVAPYALTRREIPISGRLVKILSDMQDANRDHHCKNLDKLTGRCLIHGKHPFSCDFELIRFISFRQKTNLTQKLFGRGWAMKRVDGERGALCEMVKPDQHSVAEVVRKLERLRDWANHFGIRTRLDVIIDWAQQGPGNGPLHC